METESHMTWHYKEEEKKLSYIKKVKNLVQN